LPANVVELTTVKRVFAVHRQLSSGCSLSTGILGGALLHACNVRRDDRCQIDNDQSGFSCTWTTIDGDRCSIGDNRRSIGDNRRSIGDNRRSIGDNRRSIGDNRRSIGDNRRSIGGGGDGGGTGCGRAAARLSRVPRRGACPPGGVSPRYPLKPSATGASKHCGYCACTRVPHICQRAASTPMRYM